MHLIAFVIIILGVIGTALMYWGLQGKFKRWD